ncbi:acetate kinase [Caldanaerobius fijiensis DSM 17918]|uniref:Acetate kinase n=1 Tax=Caldanaerobius fijiensis DSM 17918 TaxID=1121256 RepID=A0A1M4ZT78_9THEO|nr:acetate kinase [Caldanaerobius fijiensis]SHF21037.1 acetate kinase [Caldanaerobius fijiensis DSM 17918]
MKILVINSGSSSVKYQLIDMTDESVMANGQVQRIGLDSQILRHARYDQKYPDRPCVAHDHAEALKVVMDVLTDKELGVIDNLSEISAIGHRVVHGGEKFACSVLIDEEVMKAIKESSDLAPLHNPPNILGIEVCQKLMPGTPNVAVFDTAFHQTMPEEAFIYPLPYEYYEKYRIRRYGFHGTSHKYAAQTTAEAMKRPLEELKIVTIHLGNGSSMAAVRYGKSIDTTMGFTPLEGIPMGTRCGSIDPAIVQFLMEKEGMSIDEVMDVLNKKSGLAGVSGVGADTRDLVDSMNKGNKRARLSLDILSYQVAKYVGAYAVAMDGLDAIAFTGGIGTYEVCVRENILNRLGVLGVKLDSEKNQIVNKIVEITREDSRVKAYVIPTNEELMIARETRDLLK